MISPRPAKNREHLSRLLEFLSAPDKAGRFRDQSFGLAFTAHRNFALEERGLALRSSAEGRIGSRAMRS